MLRSTALAAALAAVTLPLGAHHSFSAEFDAKRPVSLRGTVTKVEWMNPHIYFYVDVAGSTGKPANYAVEGASPNQLRRLRWGKDSIRVGEVITVEGFRAKNGSNTVNAVTVLLKDGTSLFAGSSHFSPESLKRAK